MTEFDKLKKTTKTQRRKYDFENVPFEQLQAFCQPDYHQIVFILKGENYA